jgi:hypothetical protein
MRLAIAAAAAAVLTSASAAAAAPSVEIRDALVRVVVIPEDRPDIKVEMLTVNKDLPLQVKTQGGETVIDGGLGHRIYNCNTHGDHPAVGVRGVGRVSYEDMPQIVVHTPRTVMIEAGGAAIGAIGRSASLDLSNSGCSTWTVADVTGDAVLRESGVGNVRMGSIGRLDLRLSGAGGVHATHVRQGLDATLSGAGGVTVDELSGAIQAHISGAGHVKVLQGHAGAVRASVSGVGSVDFGGQAESLDAQISGIGSIRVKEVTGQVTKSVSGIGHVTVG